MCIIILTKQVHSFIHSMTTKPRTFVLRALPPTCGKSKSTPNGALGSFRSFFRDLIYAMDLQILLSTRELAGMPVVLVGGEPHLLSQDLWCVTDAPDHTQAARVRDCCGQLGTSRNVHPWREEVHKCGTGSGTGGAKGYRNGKTDLPRG